MLEPGLQHHMLLRRRAERAYGNVPGPCSRRGDSDRGQLSKTRRTIAPIPLESAGSEPEGPSDGAPETRGQTEIASRIGQGRFPRFDQEAYPLPRVRLCHLGRQRAPSDRLSQRMPASGRAQEPDRAFTGGHNAMPLFRLWLLFHRSAGGCSPIVRASCTINAGRSPRLRQHPPPLGGIGSQGPHHAWEARRDHALVKCTRFVRDDRPAM